MTDKKAIQITEENIEQLNIKTGTVLKDNEGTFWKITKFDDFMASMKVCDKSGNEIKDCTGNAVRSVYGGGLAGLLNDDVSTYFIETEQPEITNEPLKHVFKKEMQSLEGISKKEQEKFEKYQKDLRMIYAEDQEKFEEYQKALKMAYADGVVSFAERNKLIALKNELGLSDRDCKNMEYAYRLISEKADSRNAVQEQLQKSNSELTAEDLKNASVLLPKEQYQLVLSYIQGEEGEHFKGIIKEVSSKAEEIKGKTEILTEDEKHPLAFKYTLGNSSFYFSEWDGKDEFFGYAILNGDTQMSEWGYTSLEELKNAGGKDRNGFPVMPEMAFYRLEDTIEKQISVDYPELSEKMGFEPEKSHNEELISKFGKQIFETLQSRRLEQSAYNICCAAQFVLRTMDFSERKEVFAIMEKCGCKGKNGKEETVDFLTEIVKAENNTTLSVYDRKRLYGKINKSCETKSHRQKNKNQRFVGDYDIEV